MATTYYAPADDIGALSRYRLQDEAQRTAAADSRRRYFAQLNQAAADRYRTTAQRDVGMRDADVRRELGLGGFASQERIAGVPGLTPAQVAQFGIQMMPYERMTPAQKRGFDIQQSEIDLYRNNPNLLMDPRLAVEDARSKERDAQLKLAADSAANMANTVLQGSLGGIRDTVAQQLDKFPGLLKGMTKGNALATVDALLSGADVPADQANRPVGQAAKQFFNTAISKAASDAVMALGENSAGLVRFDPQARRFFSIYATNTTPPAQTITTQPPVITQPLTSNAPAIPAGPQSVRRYRYVPGRGLTNAPAY